MLLRIAGTLALVAIAATTSLAQTASEKYAIRQDLRNDAYVWEPLLKRTTPAPAPEKRRAPLINPGGRTAAPHQHDATARAVLSYYGARRGVTPVAPRPAAPQAVTQAAYEEPAERRPFEHAATRPTVSAYLNLYNENLGDGAPNYHAFVRPRLEQERQLENQRVEMERLRRRAQRTQAAAAPARGPMVPGVSRYGDTGRYYNGWRR
ncbi:MAG: hypothetical protein AAGJ46_02115 [Planctomycetota bacterium]